MSKWLALGLWLFVSFSAAATGSRNRPDEWYLYLKKPMWNPPGWIFAPVWTLLYAMMALAAWRVWEAVPLAESWLALGCFLAQLMANALWSWLFFGKRRIDLALLDLSLLWILVLSCLLLFYELDRVAGLLLLPYLGWLSFAGMLNVSIWRLNKRDQGNSATTL